MVSGNGASQPAAYEPQLTAAELEQVKQDTADFNAWLDQPDDPEAVSYTHLDVYKRQDTGWAGAIAVNLLFLLLYLPLQNGLDREMCAADIPDRARRLGRVWAYATLLQRGASMLGFLPLFQGQAALSAQQGSYTTLFTVQLALEIIALIAAVVSYIWMVRYLWRARKLLREEAG